MTHRPPPRPARCPSNGSPPRSTRPGDTLASPHGSPSPISATLDQDRVTMPPPPPPATAAEGQGSLPRCRTEGALRHPHYHTLERASASPPGRPA